MKKQTKESYEGNELKGIAIESRRLALSEVEEIIGKMACEQGVDISANMLMHEIKKLKEKS